MDSEAGGTVRRQFASAVPSLRRHAGWLAAALLGAWLPAHAAPPAHQFDYSWTQFASYPSSDDVDARFYYGGKFEFIARIDGERAALWRGLTINLHAEGVYGENTSASGAPMLLPPNAAMTFPVNNAEAADLAINFTQKIGKASLTFGKINMLEKAAGTPLLGGGGLEGFQHVGLAATPSLLTPPTIFGALLSVPVDRTVVTFGAWDTKSAVRKTGLESPFDEGVAAMVSVMLPMKPNGLSGYHTFSVSANNKEGLNLRDIPDLFLPPEAEAVVGNKQGAWHVKYTVQQFLRQDASGRGWGVFGHVGVWDANPSSMQWVAALGVTGQPVHGPRPDDRFGIGYFRASYSDHLRRGLQPILEIRDEQGIEVFYTWQVGRHLRLTADAQVIDSGIAVADRLVVVGLRARLGR